MKSTRYSVEQVLRKRPEIDLDWCAQVIVSPILHVAQSEGRIRFWGEVTRPGERAPRILRVVTLDDGDGPQCLLRSRILEATVMKLHSYPETDSLYVELKAAASAETREIAEGVNVDFDRDGALVGLDIDHASRRIDLSTLETSELPFRTTKAA